MPKLSEFRINKRSVDALPTGRDAVFFDADLRGFAVRTKPSGAKSYLVQYQKAGRTRRFTIGSHGQLTAAQARDQAAIILGRIKTGDDPSEQRKLDRAAITVRELAILYFEAADRGLILGKKGTAKKSSTLAVDRGRVDRHIIPLIGSRLVKDLRLADITRFLRDVSIGKTATDVRTGPRGRAIVRGGKGTASRTVGLLGGMLSFAVSEGIIELNPATGVQRPADGRRRVRLSAKQYQELGGVLRRAESAGEPWQPLAMIKLLALTGCRRGEIENLKWADVDLESAALRLSDTKTGASVRPLGTEAIAVLTLLPRTEGFVFPCGRKSDRGVQPYQGLPKVWRKLIQSNESLEELTPHTLRHGFGSMAHDAGYTELTIGALLGHSVATVTGRYVHHVDEVLIRAADRVSAEIAKMMEL
jgi:integrase